jgi:CRISPR-associated protein Cmr3
MQTLLLEPQTPLVFRGGKPFGAGTREAVHFPWPSSLAGALRTAWMRQSGCAPSQTLSSPVRGPFLLRAASATTPWEVFVPAPADALRLRGENDPKPRLVRLRPRAFAPGSGADLPAGLAPVMPPDDAPLGKPQGMPAFWPLSMLLDWDAGTDIDIDTLAAELQGPMIDVRTHVGIDRASGAAEDGRLFQTQSMDFAPQRARAGAYTTERWALAVRTPLALDPQMLTLGGERGLAWLQQPATDPLAPASAVMSRLSRSRHVALTLLSPAPLQQGLFPDWLGADRCGQHPEVEGLHLRLIAVANKRWEAVSGWDLERQQPRPMRKTVPMGTTYWFEVLETPTAPDWAQRLWLASICDRPDDRRDGWGMALPRPANIDH